jgi:anaerobic carbon-monoxide dehydrogenase iron sulfur subunit
MKQLRIDLTKCEYGRNCEHECERVCATKMFKFDDPELAALHIRKLEDGGEVIMCDQCGDCLSICPTLALKRNKNGVVMINKKVCTGCFMCIGYCAKNAFERAPGAVEPHKCTVCGHCVKACPCGALTIEDVPEPPTRLACAHTSTPAETH